MENHPEKHNDPARSGEQSGKKAHHERNMYLRFGAMLLTSTVAMFVLSYTNSYALDHLRFSEERFYMALTMGASMAIIMGAYMWGMMLKNTKLNVVIMAGGLAVGLLAFGLSQSQVLVEDRSYMRGMIPHHSIAILTSERADIEDMRVRELADEIIEAQRREIAEMDWLIKDIEDNGPAQTQEEAENRPVPDYDGQ